MGNFPQFSNRIKLFSRRKKSFKNMIISNLFLISLVPLLVIGIFLFFFLAVRLENTILAQQKLLVRAIKREINEYIKAPVFLLKQLQIQLNHETLITDKDSFLEGILKSHSYAAIVEIIDSNGKVTHIAPYNFDFIGLDISKQEIVKALNEKQEIYWSETFISVFSGVPTITLGAPLEEGAVIIHIKLQSLNEIVANMDIEKPGYSFITDNNGRLIAYPDYEKVLRQDDLRGHKVIQDALKGNYGTHIVMDGNIKELVSTDFIKAQKWIFGIVQSYDLVFKPVMDIQLIFILSFIFSIGLTIVIILNRIKNLTHPISGLITNSAKIAEGNYSFIFPHSNYFEINLLSQNFRIMTEAVKKREEDLQKMNIRISKSLEEKEVLLKEIHHRVKNNMIFLSGLFDLQQSEIEDQRLYYFLEEIKSRINSILLIHQMLYQASTYASIDFSEFIRIFAHETYSMFSAVLKEIEFQYDLEPVRLKIDQAIPCGIILNELLANAFKHAFPDRGKGIIKIALKESEAGVCLTLSDNGKGMNRQLPFVENKTLGLKLVQMLVIQLKGRLILESANETAFKITFMKKN